MKSVHFYQAKMVYFSLAVTIVQRAIGKILNAIYENDFLDCFFGFRPNRNCHDALKILNVYIEKRHINYVVDADIKGFFDNVDQEWMMKF